MAVTHGGFNLDLLAHVQQFNTDQGAGRLASAGREAFDFFNRYEPGSGTYRVDAIYSAYSDGLTSTDIDLRGSLTGPFGNTVTFPIVMGIFLKNLSTTPGQYITIGGSTNPFITWLAATGDGVRVGPQGVFCLWSPLDGYATTAATADILTIAPSSGTPKCAYMIVGRSA